MRLKALLGILLFAASLRAQDLNVSRRIVYGDTLPGVCNQNAGQVFIRTGATNPGLYRCTAANTWTQLVPHTGANADLDLGANYLLFSGRGFGLSGTTLAFDRGSQYFTGYALSVNPGTLGLYINASGNVSVGAFTITPDGPLHAQLATAGAVTAPAGSIGIFENSTDAYVTVLAPDANITGVVFGSPGDNVGAQLAYSPTANTLTLTTLNAGDSLIFGVANGATALTIDSSGNIQPAAVTQATLGTPANGSFRYCSDCTVANPCAGGGTGALAKRLNGVWVCN